MNYREKQLRQIIKNAHVPKEKYQELSQEHHDLQFAHQQILLDVDYQLQTHTKQENKELKRELTKFNQDIQDYLTKHEVDNFVELTKLIQSGQKSQEIQPLLEQKINDLETALFNLAKQKLKGKKEAHELLTQLEQNWTQTKQTLEQELTQQKQAYGDLVLENKKQIQTKQALINQLQQDKLTLQTQINHQDTKLTKQKQVLEQLLANYEQKLNELGGENDL